MNDSCFAIATQEAKLAVKLKVWRAMAKNIDTIDANTGQKGWIHPMRMPRKVKVRSSYLTSRHPEKVLS